MYGWDSDTADDLKSVGVNSPCGFESRPPHTTQHSSQPLNLSPGCTRLGSVILGEPLVLAKQLLRTGETRTSRRVHRGRLLARQAAHDIHKAGRVENLSGTVDNPSLRCPSQVKVNSSCEVSTGGFGAGLINARARRGRQTPTEFWALESRAAGTHRAVKSRIAWGSA